MLFVNYWVEFGKGGRILNFLREELLRLKFDGSSGER